MSASILVGTLIYFAISVVGLSSPIVAALLMVLPFLSAETLRRAWSNSCAPVPDPLIQRQDIEIPMPLLVGLGVYGCIIGIVLGMNSVTVRAEFGAIDAANATGMGLVALLFLLISFRHKRLDLNKLYRPLMPLLATGLLLVPLFATTYLFAVNAIVFGVYAYMIIFAAIIASEIANRFPAPALAIAGLSVLAYSIGTTIGSFVFVLVNKFIVLGNFELYVFVLVSVSALVGISAFVLNETNVASLWGLLSPATVKIVQQAEEKYFNDIARSYGLTQKEAEIMILLAEGQSAIAISKLLCISVSTARTHIKRIYSKLDVHSQTELIRKVVYEHG